MLLAFLALASSALARRYNTSSVRQEAPTLNVHVVCHTHDDVGWLKTYTQYFYGANNTYQPTVGSVQFILDTVVTSLAKNPDRRFIYVEQAYFQRWFEQQDDDTVALVKELVQQKRLEFINGGWVMHDEATTHFVGMLDQTTYGHQKLLKQFGVVPTVGWQIDPFGHSATQAALLSAEVGFQSLFFARIDWQDRRQRLSTRDMEFMWQASPSAPNSSVFTGVFPGGYGPPGGFCFDSNVGCMSSNPLIDDADDPDYNIPDFVDKFVQAALNQHSVYKGNDVMFLMGTDFMYDNAERWFANLDKLIHYVNLDGRVNALYSTPSDYAKAKLSSGIQYSTKTDDFFPYADGAQSYWTGYFTSRPALKRMERVCSGFLQSARLLEVQGRLETARNMSDRAVDELDRAVAVVQHHDGVSGTSKQHVAYDYALQMSKGLDTAEGMLAQVSAALVGSSTSPVFCRLLNETKCPFTEGSTRLAVVLHNALGQARTALVRLPLATSTSAVEVRGYNGTVIPSQLRNETIPLLEHRNDSSTQRTVLSFEATVPAAGFSTVFIDTPAAPSKIPPKFPSNEIPKDSFVVIENSKIAANFSTATGSLVSLTNKIDNVKVMIKQEWLYYVSAEPETDLNNQSSGAYIFRPSRKFPNATLVPETPVLTVSRGPVTQEVRIEVNSWISQIVRLSTSSEHLELEMTVGPVPTEKCHKLCGLEIVTRYTTDIPSRGLFFTDSNGREMQKRTLNQRPTWNLTVTEPVAGNYYPVNVAAALRGPAAHLTVLVDRSVGAASLASGQMEFMLHRRINMDDSRGVGEFLDETEGGVAHMPFYARHFGPGLTIVTTHLLALSAPRPQPKWRRLALEMFSPLVPALYPPFTPKRPQQSFLQLPDFLSLLTFQLLDECTAASTCIRVRLWHSLSIEEASGPIKVDLSTLFSAWPSAPKVVGVTETSLTGNQVRGPVPVGVVSFNPMQIRTFVFALA